jgi:hypothetical protein
MRIASVAHRLRVPCCLLIAIALWVAALPWVFSRNSSARDGSDRSARLARAQLDRLADPGAGAVARDALRATNAEWDFMSRTFLVLSLANMALRDSARQPEHLTAIDTVIDDTLRAEREGGLYHFLMPYAQAKPFVLDPPRSQFVDGEIALMLGMRRLVAEKAEYRAPFLERLALIEERMQKSPVLCAESYPDECWTFCNTVALAALRIADALDGTDHRRLFERWLGVARERLVDPRTGLIASSYTVAGDFLDGPEGSSLWLSAHMLELIDPAFARDQYTRAKTHLARSAFGFAWAAEWPESWRGPDDVDSGPVLPLIDASAGSSGLALLGASAFGDTPFFTALSRTLALGAFPLERHGGLRYAAAGPIGDAVILYSGVVGPAWQKIEELMAARRQAGAS